MRNDLKHENSVSCYLCVVYISVHLTLQFSPNRSPHHDCVWLSRPSRIKRIPIITPQRQNHPLMNLFPPTNFYPEIWDIYAIRLLNDQIEDNTVRYLLRQPYPIGRVK